MPEIWNKILESLKQEQKSISQIAEDTNLSLPVTTYHVMTLVKYGYVNPTEMDEMDEFYFYELIK